MEGIENMSLKTKLFHLQCKALRIGKNAEAGSGGKWSYKYATLDKIWDVIDPLMGEFGILESSAIKYNDQGQTFVYTTIYNVHNEDDSMCSLFPLDNTLSPQDMGKVITYGRRYNLVALLNLKIVGEDDDAQGVGAKKASAPNGNNFVSTIIKNGNVEKAKTLLAKAQAGEYSLSPDKLSELEDFITDNE